MKDHEPVEKEASVQEKWFERGGQNLLFVMICCLLVGLAAPLLLVFLIKSPQPEQHIFILGISYYKLVFIFFLSAAIMVHASLFFLRANPLTIFLIFILSLFCCFPLIVGLRNNLTLQQAIIDVPFFSSWPFFLKPAYIMIEFLIPAGIIIYLFLQIKSVFFKKSRTYAFFCAAVYLSMAACMGFSALIQAEEPNIVSALARKKGGLVQKDVATVFPGMSPQDFPSGKDTLPSEKTLRSPVPQIQNDTNPESPAPESRPSLATQDPPLDKISTVELEQEMRLLSGKVDRIIVELGQMKTLIMERQENLQKKKADAVVQKKEISESRPTTATKDPPTNRTAIVELRQEVRLLIDKVDHISDALGRMASLLPERQDNLQKDEAMVEEKEGDG